MGEEPEEEEEKKNKKRRGSKRKDSECACPSASSSSSDEEEEEEEEDEDLEKRGGKKCFPKTGGCGGGGGGTKEEEEEEAAAAAAKRKKKKKKRKRRKVRVNPCLVFLNILFVCAGVGFVGVGVWLSLNHGTNCVHFLQTFLIGAGIFMVVVAAAGIVGAYWSFLPLLYFNFFMLLLLLLLLVATTVFVLFVTSRGISASLRSSHDPFSSWLRDQVNQRIRSCTRDGQICRFVQYSYTSGYYSRPRLSALQTACCQPPAGCNSNNLAGNDTALAIESDCEAWRKAGVTTGFCSKCSLCRVAVAENIRHVWHTIAIFKVITLLILLPAYFITCCNFNKQEDPGDGSGKECQRCLDCCFNVL